MLLIDMKEENDSLTCAITFAIKLKNIKEEHQGKFIYCNIEYYKEK